MRIPIIHYNNPKVKEKFVDSIRKTGFAVLTGTFIEKELINTVYKDFQNLFNSKEKKTELLFNKETQEGYFPMKSEKSKDSQVFDLKEFFHYYPNRSTANFATVDMKDLNLQLEYLAVEILGWLEEDYNKNHIKNSAGWGEMVANSQSTLLRGVHYPPLRPTDDPRAVRAAAHEDICLITLLPASTEPGLQVKDREGGWIDVGTDINSIIINVGDLLAYMTSNHYPSTTHQVANPIGENKSRYSIPFFLHPHANTPINGDKTAGEFLDERLKELGLL